MDTRLIVMLALLLMVSINHVRADEKDLGLVAKTSFIAFECSHLAALAKDQKELERLFIIGLESGRTYVSAARAGELTEKNNKSAQIGVLWTMEGPSVDFIVGRIFEVAAQEARDKAKPFGNTTDFVGPAKQAFNAMNCALIK